jgi:hypothetical protein
LIEWEVKMFGLKLETTAKEPTPPYATAADFCRIFMRNMDGLYLLSFLLTADHTIAERCFVSGLDTSAKGNTVFKEWAESWARRVIIQNAIQMVRPRLADGTPDRSVHGEAESAEIAAILELPAFERFAFVMSVLERHSDQECSLLLNCMRADVSAARTRALEQLGRSAARRELSVVGTEQEMQSTEHGKGLHLAFARLAPTA